LATELAKRDTGRTLYILDEPTTGLHFEDVRLLLEVLHRLVDKGNTVVVIEHNLDVVKTADWVIDLGPEGGAAGGAVVAAGAPEDVARVKGSFTGQFLLKALAVGDYVGKFTSRRTRSHGNVGTRGGHCRRGPGYRGDTRAVGPGRQGA